MTQPGLVHRNVGLFTLAYCIPAVPIALARDGKAFHEAMYTRGR